MTAESMKKLSDVTTALQQLVETEQLLITELESKISDLDKSTAEHRKLSEDIVSRHAAIEAKEKIYGSAEQVAERETAVIEREKKLAILKSDYDATVKAHDQRMVDEKSTLVAAQQRLKNAEIALDKERTTYADRIRKEFFADVASGKIKVE